MSERWDAEERRADRRWQRRRQVHPENNIGEPTAISHIGFEPHEEFA